MTAGETGPLSQTGISLGLRANWRQFSLLVLINAFVGGMVGIERTVVPLIGVEEFHLASTTLIGSFLKHLEDDRGNSPRTRNARLGAIHSFYRFAALEHPEHAHTIARVMAIPTKRYERNTVNYLDRDEIAALLAAPRQTHLARPTRPRATGAHDPDRRAGLRTHRPARR